MFSLFSADQEQWRQQHRLQVHTTLLDWLLVKQILPENSASVVRTYRGSSQGHQCTYLNFWRVHMQKYLLALYELQTRIHFFYHNLSPRAISLSRP